MTVELSPEQENALQWLIDKGYYDSPEDFIEQAITGAKQQQERQKHDD